MLLSWRKKIKIVSFSSRKFIKQRKTKSNKVLLLVWFFGSNSFLFIKFFRDTRDIISEIKASCHDDSKSHNSDNNVRSESPRKQRKELSKMPSIEVLLLDGKEKQKKVKENSQKSGKKFHHLKTVKINK